MVKNIIQAKDLTKIYGSKRNQFAAIDGVSLTIESGQSLAIVGKSGSGKSTLMHLLASLDRPTSGELLVGGQDVTTLSGKQLSALRNKRFGFVFQQFFVNPRQNCLENVCLPLTIRGVGVRERHRRGMEVLEAVGMANIAQQKANDLSGGQKQRLCVARALIGQPEVLFADEPTGNLDSENGRMVTDMLFDLQQKRGITLIMVTHDPDLAALCQRQITISDGKIVNETGQAKPSKPAKKEAVK